MKGRRKPAYRLVPPSDGSRGPEAVRLMAAAGLELDGWQKDVLKDGMSTLGDDWAADEIAVLVARQNGKSLALLARALWGVTLGPERLVMFTAHQFRTARESFLLAKQICETDAFSRFEPVPRVGHGQEGIYFGDGSRLLFLARSRISGRGFSPDLVIVDEAFELSDVAMDALKPSLSAARRPQLWFASSAPHETSAVLRRMCVAGRAGSSAARTVYLEWSAPDGVDPTDPKAWAAANPALGTRIRPEFVASERTSLSPAGFDRERLGRWDVEQGGEWISPAEWSDCASTDEAVDGARVLALVGSPDGSSAGLVSATVSSSPFLEVLGSWSEPIDVLEIERAIRDACRVDEVLRVCADPARWSRSLQVLARDAVPVVEYPLTAARMIPAVSRFREAVDNRQLRHGGPGSGDSPERELEQAITLTTTKVDDRGRRIHKDRPLAVAAVVAFEQAADLAMTAFVVW